MPVVQNADHDNRQSTNHQPVGSAVDIGEDYSAAAGVPEARVDCNVTRLHIDLSRLDAVVISHRHGDHTSGLSYLLPVNPNVKIYTRPGR
jgi:glyoxylase-like metal-dependent hydrolase (beta-lactamase superfamily II)